MTDIAIRVEKLGKKYRIGERERYLALRDVLARGAKAPLRWFSQQRAKRNGQNDLTLSSAHVALSPVPSSEFWALKDVSFEIKQGEVVGIIGRNGAGKSTLLKILSRITKPTEGYADIDGRVGSLLEVGTGFHPELTGRENIYLNGAILGMKKTEIERKFDEIVAFAEVEKFLETPVKHYSSGMYVRLAFAVAAHLEPEILVVDEVLAVGDAEFQKKCLGKMQDVATREHRTVLFVSHNMGAITLLCSRCLLVDSGRLIEDGPVTEVVNVYQHGSVVTEQCIRTFENTPRTGTGRARFTGLSIKPLAPNHTDLSSFVTGCDAEITTAIHSGAKLSSVNVAVIIYDSAGYRLVDINIASLGDYLNLAAGHGATVTFFVENLLLAEGTYFVGLWMGIGGVEEIDSIEHATAFEVVEDRGQRKHTETFPGRYRCKFGANIKCAAEQVDTADSNPAK
jgi:homopolymeric O-antigen transport system ATP-binding protein